MSIDDVSVWNVLLAGAELCRIGTPLGTGVWSFKSGVFEVSKPDDGILVVSSKGWALREPLSVSDKAKQMFDLYSPLCATSSFVIAHLGQTITGHIATHSGESRFITGKEDVIHNHRLRALSDGVLVGASTAALDNPELTTRLVEGPNPVRIVLDPRRRLPESLKLFRDGVAPTILLCPESSSASGAKFGLADVVGVPDSTGSYLPQSITQKLAENGIKRLFIEGGGTTVATFLKADHLDRLQLTIAPTLMGQGRLALPLTETIDLADALMPDCRHFSFGNDVLFDFDMRAPKRLPLLP